MNGFVDGDVVINKDENDSTTVSPSKDEGSTTATLHKEDSTSVTTPEKIPVDKLDDASTSDSGSALDVEETSSVEYPTSSYHNDSQSNASLNLNLQNSSTDSQTLVCSFSYLICFSYNFIYIYICCMCIYFFQHNLFCNFRKKMRV